MEKLEVKYKATEKKKKDPKFSPKSLPEDLKPWTPYGKHSIYLILLAVSMSIAMICLVFLWFQEIPKTINEQNEKIQEITKEIIQDDEDVCINNPDAGPCEAIIPRFFFDYEDETCKPFSYGGCGGNGNNFITEEDCQNKCRPEKDASQATGRQNVKGKKILII